MKWKTIGEILSKGMTQSNFHLNSIILAAYLTDYEEDLLGGYCSNQADRVVARSG